MVTPSPAAVTQQARPAAAGHNLPGARAIRPLDPRLAAAVAAVTPIAAARPAASIPVRLEAIFCLLAILAFGLVVVGAKLFARPGEETANSSDDDPEVTE